MSTRIRSILLAFVLAGCVRPAPAPTQDLDGPEPPASAIVSTQPIIAPPSGKDVAAAAAEYIGVREATGHNDGPVVEYFLANTGLGKGYAWCGSFAYTAYKEAGIRPPGKPSAYAWVPTWFADTERLVPVKEAEPGDVGGIYFRSLGRMAHLFVVEAVDGDNITTVEGNTNDKLSRDGDGVYRKRRKAGTIKAAARWW